MAVTAALGAVARCTIGLQTALLGQHALIVVLARAAVIAADIVRANRTPVRLLASKASAEGQRAWLVFHGDRVPIGGGERALVEIVDDDVMEFVDERFSEAVWTMARPFVWPIAYQVKGAMGNSVTDLTVDIVWTFFCAFNAASGRR